MSGILLQWYAGFPVLTDWSIFLVVLCLLLITQCSGPFFRFRFYWINGLLIQALLVCLGLLLTAYQNIPPSQYQHSGLIIARLEEPLTEKEKSFKAEASVQFPSSKSRIIIYFRKNARLPALAYGNMILFSGKSVQPIRNAGNPGSFDYEQYCAFRHINGQAYLKTGDFIVLPSKEENPVKKMLFAAREKLTGMLRILLKGEKETALAEALLIGYKEDMDKTLMQSYSNTGTVHIIAISGLHLALIYWLLRLAMKPFELKRSGRWLRPLLIIAALWMFSILSGASPSALRSALMFSCIAIGESFSKQTSVYNTLSASAFLLLCYDPFWLWDAGFQLSYGAVLSIVVFMKPVYHCILIQNKLLDGLWKSVALTLSAQVLTAPVSIYHFHQFPNYFLFSNLLAVPLSSLILLGELLLYTLSFILPIAKAMGFVLSRLIWFMNSFIEYIEKLPFSVWNNLQIDILQLVLIYIVIAGLSCWLMQKQFAFLFSALVALLGFAVIRTYHFSNTYRQNLLLVYNIPGHQAIEFIEGRKYQGKYDDKLYENKNLRDFYLRPSSIFYRIHPSPSLDLLSANGIIFLFHSKRIITIDRSVRFIPPPARIHADLIIISKNPDISIQQLDSVFDCRQWVFDASNSIGNINRWKQSCLELGLSFHDVSRGGAFAMKAD